MQHIMISWSKALGSFMVNVYDLRHQLNFLQVAGEHMCSRLFLLQYPKAITNGQGRVVTRALITKWM